MLAEKKCVPCEGGVPPLTESEIAPLLSELSDPSWKIDGAKKLMKEWKFEDFKQSMHFVNAVAKIAEEEGHHPDIWISYNIVRLELSTHAIGGLSENDFILAAKIKGINPGASPRTPA